MFQNYYDSHTHTKNSPDGFDPLDILCEAAIQKKMKGFSVTDHFECNERDSFLKTIEGSYADVQKAKQTYAGKLTVTAGIELGQPLQNKKAAEEILCKYPFDFVLSSLHCNANGPDYYCIDYSTADVPTLLRGYYEELLEMAKWNQFDVLGHITYPLRYMMGDYGMTIDMDLFRDLIDEMLRVLVKNHKGIEINTSGLRQPLGETMPGLRIIKRFRQLGGEVITIGSDSHTARDLGKGIKEGMELLLEAGFQYMAFFENREPKMYKIV